MCLAQGHNAVTLVRLEPSALCPRSRVKHYSQIVETVFQKRAIHTSFPKFYHYKKNLRQLDEEWYVSEWYPDDAYSRSLLPRAQSGACISTNRKCCFQIHIFMLMMSSMPPFQLHCSPYLHFVYKSHLIIYVISI